MFWLSGLSSPSTAMKNGCMAEEGGRERRKEKNGTITGGWRMKGEKKEGF